MSKPAAPSLLVLCAVLAACTDANTDRAVTAPEAPAAFSDTPADSRGAVTYDGPLDLVLAPDAASAQMAAAAPQAAPHAATGGRASGHVGLRFTPPFFNLVTQEYSFVALR